MNPKCILWSSDFISKTFLWEIWGRLCSADFVKSWAASRPGETKSTPVDIFQHGTGVSTLPELSCGFGSEGLRGRGNPASPSPGGGPSAKHHLDSSKRTVRNWEKALLQIYRFQNSKGSQRAKRSEFFMTDWIKPRRAIKLLFWCDVIPKFLLLGFFYKRSCQKMLALYSNMEGQDKTDAKRSQVGKLRMSKLRMSELGC